MKDTFKFVNDLNQLNCKEKFLISYDVVSLYTNIPLNETIALAVDILINSKPDLKISKSELSQLFEFATAQTHFLFEDKIYDQIDGVAMGSPLAPVLANLFMGYHEKNWLNNYDNAKPIVYKRYVDDIFCLFDNETVTSLFLKYLNKQHSNIKFTSEPGKSGNLPFVDVNIDKKEYTSLFHKSSYTGLVTNFLSYTPQTYKLALIKSLNSSNL